MSAPEPEKWAMTAEEIEQIQFDADAYGIDSDECQSVFERIARRRALEELRALAKMECQWCRDGEEYRKGGMHYEADGTYLALCDAENIHDRIAEIEAEAE